MSPLWLLCIPKLANEQHSQFKLWGALSNGQSNGSGTFTTHTHASTVTYMYTRSACVHTHPVCIYASMCT